MSKGENIFRRKDGRWEARYRKGRSPSGKIMYGFCYGKTYKEAKQKVESLRVSLAIGIPVVTSPGKQPFSMFCDEWFCANRSRFRDATQVKYCNIIEKHIKPCLGDYRPARINDTIVGTFTGQLIQDSGLAPKTVRDILTLLKAILSYTHKQLPYGLQRTEIIYPKTDGKEMRVLSVKEQKKLVSYLTSAMDECRFGILLGLLTGARIGEICALRWKNISLTENCMHIGASMQRLKDIKNHSDHTIIVIGPPKSSRSVRTIPLTNYASALCRNMYPGDPDAFILTGTRSYMEPRTLQYRLARYTKECDLEGVHFHTLRHTFATRAVEVGFDIKSLSDIMGHSTTTVTLEKYVHSNLELKKSNMDKLALYGL